MSFRLIQHRRVVLRALIALTVTLFVAALDPTAGSAQSCTNCTLYARTELNLREGPSLDSPVLRFIPVGAAVQRAAGAGSNGFAPVTYEGVSGWTVALGLVTTPEAIDATAAPSAPAEPAPATSEIRVTLAPLMLRSGPGEDAEPILVIPEGGRLTLTRVGAENGYVTADYEGATGWVYADLIAREDEIG